MKKYGIHLIYISLVIAAFAAYEPILHNSFINFDDDAYIYKNPNVTSGLKLDNIIWAFTNIHSNNYHPLTSISHMLDCELYQLATAGHHFTNLVFHLVNTALMMLVLSKMTGRMWPSVFVAALFALHPLHVESVAWASERKDVLSTFFWLLTMLAYWYYIQKPVKSRYMLALGLFTLGLLSKPMVVTLPFVLLLMDYWPFERFKKSGIGKLIAEKIPFFALTIIISIVTLIVQGKTGLVKPMVNYPMGWRVENAIVSYIIYIGKMFWPLNLAIFYPHPKGTLTLVETLGALAVLIAITIFAFWKLKQKPYIMIGWLWFVGTLVPVIGLCQVGMQAWANRYTYIPYTGLFIAITWWVCDALAKVKYRKIICGSCAGVILFGLGVKTYIQTLYWHDNITLYSHAINAVENNWWAYGFLGTELGLRGEYDEASKMFEKSLEIYPDNASFYYEYAKISMFKSDWKTAIKMYEKLLPPLPDDLNAPRGTDTTRFDYPMLKKVYLNSNVNMALALAEEGRYAESQRRYQEALRVEPDLPEAKDGLKKLKEQMNKKFEVGDGNSVSLK